MIRISAVYANTPGSRFDGAYYCGMHAALATRLLGPHGLQSIRITLGTEGLDGAPPPFWAISEMLFDSREAFATAISIGGEALFADAPNYTDVEPVLQLSTLAGD